MSTQPISTSPTDMPPDPIGATAQERRLEITAAGASCIISIVLLLIKFVAYLRTGSAVILSDAMESIVNVVAAAFAYYSIRLAHRPADMEHPYGHGKIEFMSAGLEGGMILLASLVISFIAIREMFEGPGAHHLDLGLILIVIAAVINGVAGFILVRIGRMNGSMTLVADGKHLLSDFLTSIGIVAALLLMFFKPTWTWADPIAALIVGVYLITVGISLLRSSFAGLMDAQDKADDIVIRGILDGHVSGTDPRICSYHKLRHRHSGRYHWVDFHIMVPAQWTVTRGHAVASTIEYEIEQALGVGNATAHIEPCAETTCAHCTP